MDDAHPLIDWNLLEGPHLDGREDGCVVHQDIAATEFLVDGRRGLLHALNITHIHRNGQTLPSVIADLPGDPVHRVGIDVQGHDAVVNLVAILHGSADAFEQVHVRLPEMLARACAETGVRRLVHVSALGADEQGPSMYQRSKGRGEAALQAAAARGDIDLTLLQPSVIFGRDDRFINLFAQLQRVFPVMPLAGADTRFQPVWVDDVAAALVHALEHRRAIGQTYELAGPEVLSLRELVQLAGRHIGCPRPVIALPHAVGWLQALAMEWLPGPTLMSRDNLASMQVDNVASGRHPDLSALGVSAPRRLAQVFPPSVRG